MKIRCPKCGTGYTIPDEKISSEPLRAVCKKCGAKIVIRKKSGSRGTPSQAVKPPARPRKRPTPGAAAIQAEGKEPLEKQPGKPATPGRKKGPSYQKFGVAAVGGGIVVVIILVLVGIYYSGPPPEKPLAVPGQTQVESRKKLPGHPQTYGVCESFLRDRGKLLLQLGRITKVSPVKESLGMVDGRDAAKTVMIIQGSSGEKHAYFRLKKYEGKWRVTRVTLQHGKGELETLYPVGEKSKPGKTPVEKSSPRTRLAGTADNQGLAGFVKGNPDVKVLLMDRRTAISDISPLAGLGSLVELNMSWCKNVSDISPLSGLTGLKRLYLHKCDSVRDLSPLRKLTGLTHLSMPPGVTNADLKSVLPKLPMLEQLTMSSCYGITDISPIVKLRRLSRLVMDHIHGVKDLSPLSRLAVLKNLHMTHSKVRDLGPLKNLSRMRSLWLPNNADITDISPLAGMIGLQSLSLEGCKEVVDVSPLSRLSDLKYISLKGLHKIKDISALGNLRRLRKLDIRECTMLTGDQIAVFKKALPRVKIKGP